MFTLRNWFALQHLDELGNTLPRYKDKQWQLKCLLRAGTPSTSVSNLPAWVEWVPPRLTAAYARFRLRQFTH